MRNDDATIPERSAADRQALRSLLVLTLVHFTVDFYGGLTVPIAEPTLTDHLGVGLPAVAFLIGGCALLVNLIQPLSQWILPKGGAPILLLVAPLMAAGTSLIGLSSSFAVVAMLMVISATGIGIVHPESALAAHSLAGSRKGIALGLFMAAGYLGFSMGGLLSGLWAGYRQQGLARFWWLALPALISAVLVLRTRLYRLEGHLQEDPPAAGDDGRLPVGLVLLLAFCITINLCLLIRFLPIFLVRSFPGPEAQQWAGGTAFSIGISGVAGMFLWGHLSDRFGTGRTMTLALPAGLPFLWLLLRIESAAMAPVWAAFVGATLGALFPLCVVLARHARGLPQRLRMGLVIGGAWGLGGLAFVLGGAYIGRFPPGAVAPVQTMLRLCWVLTIGSTLLAWIVSRDERRHAFSEPKASRAG